MMLTDLADVLRAAGLTVVEESGWRTRGHGAMTDVLGSTCHHTAPGIRSLKPRLSLGVVKDGRPDLPGPLAHLYLDRDGTYHVVAAGRCYHAGESIRPEYTNSHRIGTEAEAAGDGWSEDWPDVQMDAYARGQKALSQHYRFPVSEILGHKETCAPKGRKSDPSFNMDAFRSRVAAVDLEESIDMTEAEVRATVDAAIKAAIPAIVTAINAATPIPAETTDGRKINQSIATVLDATRDKAQDALDALARIEKTITTPPATGTTSTKEG